MPAPVEHHRESGLQYLSRNMCRFTVFSFLLCGKVFSASIDQRQTGDLNVQIDLKNLNIFALTKGKEEYVDYDYAYDYSEMTIKPQNGSTSTTIKPLNNTIPAAVQTEKDNASISDLETTTKFVDNSPSTSEQMVIINSFSFSQQPLVATATTTAVTVTNSDQDVVDTSNDNQNTTLVDCKKGFFRNNLGTCELKLQNPSNVLLKMLQQKSKPGAGGNTAKKT